MLDVAFRPGGPIDQLTLFSGRTPQIQEVASAVIAPGYHVALYGERGVGKTSLSKVLAELFDAPDLPTIRDVLVTCNTESTYDSIWRDIFRELDLEFDGEASPENVRYEVAKLDPPAVIVIDELDRVEDDLALTLLADTIKSFSDRLLASTLILVGVARSVGDLVGEHESIVRNLAQIEMPRMSMRELAGIIVTGCEQCGLTIRPDAMSKIVTLSEGLPHYTHLLTLHAARRVVQNDRTDITLTDVNASIPGAVARHTIQSAYLKAVRSTRSANLYAKVLLACALAPKNQLGYFTAGSIRDALQVIAGRRIDIPAFARHLANFLEPERASILVREGEPRNYFYRFSDPIMQPYVVLTGLAEGLVADAQLEQLAERDYDARATPGDYEANAPQPLF